MLMTGSETNAKFQCNYDLISLIPKGETTYGGASPRFYVSLVSEHERTANRIRNSRYVISRIGKSMERDPQSKVEEKKFLDPNLHVNNVGPCCYVL